MNGRDKIEKIVAPIFFLVLSTVGGTAVYGAFREIAGAKIARSYVSQIADTNKDGVTSSDEWATVYKDLGKPYDVHLSNPSKDFSRRELVDYLSRHTDISKLK